ncbi:hypothetical protein Tco_0752884 [Tanacetum coccineum]
MAETMVQYKSKTRADYGSGVARPKIKDKDNFELKGQFLKELRTNTFSGSDQEDAKEHIEKVLEIVDLFHIPNITIDQVMLRAFPVSLTGAASRIMEMKPEFENMTLNEYLEYEAAKERRLRTFNYPYYHEDIEIDKYHGFPPLHPCFQSAQPYTEDGLLSSYESDEMDIDSMTIAEYELYIDKQGQRKNPLNDHSYSFTSNSGDQSPDTPNPQPDDKELSFEEDVDDINVWEKEEAQVVREEEPDNDIDSISIQVPDVMDNVIQPLILQSIHTTPATKSILDELLDEFSDEIMNITMVDEEADFNPTRDLEELDA